MRVQTERVRGQAVLTVENDGEPVPEQDLPRLWEPFFKGDPFPQPGPRRGRAGAGHRPRRRVGPWGKLYGGEYPRRRPVPGAAARLAIGAVVWYNTRIAALVPIDRRRRPLRGPGRSVQTEVARDLGMGFNRPEAKFQARNAMRGAYPHPMLVTLVYVLLTSVLASAIMYFVNNPFQIAYVYLLDGIYDRRRFFTMCSSRAGLPFTQCWSS